MAGGLYGDDALRTVAGTITFFIGLVGLAGRYDMTLAAIATAFGLRRLLRPGRP